MPERVAVYAGSFDPPTLGHLDLIERAQKMFDKVIVAVGRNKEKTGTFTADERMEMLNEITTHLDRVEVTSFRGLTVDFAKKQGAIALIRGLRVLSDFEYELTLAVTNHKLDPDLDTVCLMPSERYLLVSSRFVREIAMFGGDVSTFVPKPIEERLKKKYAQQAEA